MIQSILFPRTISINCCTWGRSKLAPLKPLSTNSKISALPASGKDSANSWRIPVQVEVLWQKNFERYSNIIEHRSLLDDSLDGYRQELADRWRSLWEREHWMDAKERILKEREKRLQEQEEIAK